MTETWRDIPGYEGIYQASIYGYVRSVKRIVLKGRNHIPTIVKGKVIAPWLDRSGYLKVDLYRNGNRRCEKVHQMVAKAFIRNPENKATVNHKDENPLNNTVSNLEWMTNKENVNYGTRVQRVRERYGYRVFRIAPNGITDDFFTLHDAEKKTGISRQSITYAIKHRTKLKGYSWQTTGGD